MKPHDQYNSRNRFHELRQHVEAILANRDDLKNDDDLLNVRRLLGEMERALNEQESMLQAVFENSPYISVVVDADGRVQNINHAGASFAGLEKQELLDLLGGEVFGCINAFHGLGCGMNEECSDCPIRTRVTYTLTTGEPIFSGEGKMTFVRGNQQINLNILVSTTPIEVEKQSMVLVTIIDISDRKQMETKLAKSNENLRSRVTEIESLQEQLREQAIRDPLTELFNRRYLQETLDREIARAEQNGRPVSLIIMDLDHFKRINDTYGHVAGDTILIAIGKLIRANCREDDVACRYGGEEFLVVMPGAPIQVAQKRANLLCDKIQKLNVNYNDHIMQTTVSLGVAAFPVDGSSGEEILICADRALYQAKQDGRNRVSVFKDASNILQPWE